MPTLSASSVKELVTDYQVISFDVFDTLLCRRVFRPADVFTYMESKTGINGFAAKRQQAEAEARRRNHSGRGVETTLSEIYSVLDELLELPEGTQAQELTIEKKLLRCNETVRPYLDAARAAKKRVIAVSDMYLNSSEIDELLKASGIIVDRVYSSADFVDRECGKFNKHMYAEVCRQENVSPQDILHFGDHVISDVENALESGVTGVFTPKNSETASLHVDGFGNILKAANGTLSTSIIVGELVKKAAQLGAIEERSFGYEFGYFYGGPLIAGFVKFLLERAQEDNVTRLHMLARDGFVLKDALDILRVNELSYDVVPSSRRMCLFAAASQGEVGALEKLFEGHADTHTPRQFLNILSLGHLSNRLVGNIDETCNVEQFLSDNQEFLLERSKEEAIALKAFFGLLNEGQDAPETAWVDVGWGLSSIGALDQILGSKQAGYFVGTHSFGLNRPGLSSYLFHRDGDIEKIIMRCPELIELVFSDVQAGFSNFELKDGIPKARRSEKPRPEGVRDSYVKDVRAGCMGFLAEIADLFDQLSVDELAAYNKAIWCSLITTPTQKQYSYLGNIPHARGAGDAKWNKISDFWVFDKPEVRERSKLMRKLSKINKMRLKKRRQKTGGEAQE